jgi:hypothetical protein
MRGDAEQSFDELLESLSNPYRRQLLVALLEHNPQDDSDRDPLDILSASGEPDGLETALVHNHLPRLEQLGYISWNKETNELSRGPKWDDIAPLLELIHTHRDELPSGWL